jgi:bifunctional DNA-binding transcriptional regulator/antitoxin component of YhaV-PrlF toxin-antitoxin module
MTLMTKLAVTSKGQIKLGKEVLRHLGIEAGDKVSIDLLPGGTVTLTGVKANTGVEKLFGILHDPDQPPLSLEEIEQTIADGWAGIRRSGKPRA